ncbi:MAG: hypothetical protein JW712_01700 [Dehalococcoidales bacterium]|nr:hypothetical protein [Dehalococcoidales bacterium]
MTTNNRIIPSKAGIRRYQESFEIVPSLRCGRVSGRGYSPDTLVTKRTGDAGYTTHGIILCVVPSEAGIQGYLASNISFIRRTPSSVNVS